MIRLYFDSSYRAQFQYGFNEFQADLWRSLCIFILPLQWVFGFS